MIDVDSEITLERTAARETVYRLLSALFTEPQSERFRLLYDPEFQQLSQHAIDCLREHAIDGGFGELGKGEGDPKEIALDPVLMTLPPSSGEAMEGYATVFGFTMAKDCPPYSVEYCANSDAFYRSQRLADIAGFYKAFGLERSESYKDREDHAVYLFEFMAFLLAKQNDLEAEGGPKEQREVVANGIARFFEDHCGWWLPAFAFRVANKPGVTDFYRAVAGLLSQFTAWERSFLRLPPNYECPEPNVKGFEPEGDCFSCEVGKLS